jgi:hypothetical protein
MTTKKEDTDLGRTTSIDRYLTILIKLSSFEVDSTERAAGRSDFSHEVR